MSLPIGQHVRVELRATALQDTNCEVLAVGEDRHRILNPDYGVYITEEPGEQLLGQFERAVWGLGSVVPRLAGHRLVWDVVVYDIDTSPMVRPDDVQQGLVTLFTHLTEVGLSRVAMEPIGMLHRGLSAAEFAAALQASCADVSADVDILLCHESAAVIDDLTQLLSLPH